MLKKRNDFEIKYNKFLNELRDEIISGQIKPGEFILPENTLSKVYELSRISIRKGLAELVSEGLIEKIPGKGTRVSLSDQSAVQTIKVGWFSNSYETDIIKKIKEQFEQLNPYVNIDLQLLPGTDYVYSLVNLIERGEGPDVFVVSDAHFRNLEALNKLSLIEAYLPADIQPERDSYPKVFEMFSKEKQTIATPFVFSPVIICYNKKMFSEAGISPDDTLTSWDDLVRVAKDCTTETEDNIINHYGFCFSASSNRWPVFMLQNGGRFFNKDRSQSIMNSEENREALNFCVDLMYKHKVSPVFSHGNDELAEKIFMRERAAMILTTYYFLNEFRNHDIDWNLMPLPKHKENATLLIGGSIALNKYSKMKETAKSFIDYLVSTEAQTLIKRNGCTIPMLRSVAEDNHLLNPDIHPENYNAFKEVLPYAYPMKELQLSHADIEILENELNLLWANMTKPEEACERVETLLNEKLNMEASEN